MSGPTFFDKHREALTGKGTVADTTEKTGIVRPEDLHRTIADTQRVADIAHKTANGFGNPELIDNAVIKLKAVAEGLRDDLKSTANPVSEPAQVAKTAPVRESQQESTQEQNDAPSEDTPSFRV